MVNLFNRRSILYFFAFSKTFNGYIIQCKNVSLSVQYVPLKFTILNLFQEYCVGYLF